MVDSRDFETKQREFRARQQEFQARQRTFQADQQEFQAQQLARQREFLRPRPSFAERDRLEAEAQSKLEQHRAKYHREPVFSEAMLNVWCDQYLTLALEMQKLLRQRGITHLELEDQFNEALRLLDNPRPIKPVRCAACGHTTHEGNIDDRHHPAA